jgi:hypothetical protein
LAGVGVAKGLKGMTVPSELEEKINNFTIERVQAY